MLRLVLKKLEGLSVDETGSGSFPVADFGNSNVELPASVTTLIIYVIRVKLQICRIQHCWRRLLIQMSSYSVEYF